MLWSIPSIMTSSFGTSSRYYRSLTIDEPGSDLTNFPFLFYGTYSYLATVANGGKVQNANGYDIMFYSDSGLTTKLDFEIEKWDATTGEIIAWVRIPTLSSSSNTVIYLSYGDTSITTDQSNKSGLWTDFQNVLHFDDNAASTTVIASKGNNGTNIANTSTKTATGVIGNGLTYNGTSDATSLVTDLSSFNKITIEYWSYWDAFSDDDELLGEYTSNYNSASGGFLIDPNSGIASDVFMAMRTPSGYNTSHFTRPSAGAWHHYAIVFDRTAAAANQIIPYLDGSITSYSKTASTAMTGNFDNSTLYLMSRAASSLFAAGKLDELKLIGAVLSADWIAAEYSNQNAPSSFYSVGAETAA